MKIVTILEAMNTQIICRHVVALCVYAQVLYVRVCNANIEMQIDV